MNDANPAVHAPGRDEPVLRGQQRRTAGDSAAYLLPQLKPGLSLLDVGCGPGSITADLAAVVAPGPVTAIDIFDDVLDAARAEAARRAASNVSFVRADVHKLDCPDDAFDVVHAHQVLQHVADPVQALREMRRVCRTGGIVAARASDVTMAVAKRMAAPARHGWTWMCNRLITCSWLTCFVPSVSGSAS